MFRFQILGFWSVKVSVPVLRAFLILHLIFLLEGFEDIDFMLEAIRRKTTGFSVRHDCGWALRPSLFSLSDGNSRRGPKARGLAKQGATIGVLFSLSGYYLVRLRLGWA